MIKLENNAAQRTISMAFSGQLTDAEIDDACSRYQTMTDTYKRRPHLLLADLRGLAPLSPVAAGKFGTYIHYGRTHGVQACVHLSDSHVVKLQAARLAREVDPQDDRTINVVSVEEARAVLAELRLKL